MDFSDTVELAALGRPFSLGALYDCRKDSLVPGLTLWDSNDLKEHIQERPQAHNEFDVVASESIEGKSSALNVNASLKASFLCSLVEVDGSAKYLNDNKTSKNQARVTFNYKATKKVRELSMNHLGKDNVKHQYVFDMGLATHVVTAILYGAQAFFVFDREVSEKEDLQDIQGSLKGIVKKIPYLSIDGENSLKMKDKDKAHVDKFSCRFYGDFCLDKPPTTFQDAVKVYQSLPKLLGPDGENAVPVKVWLLPLTKLKASAAKLVRQISTGLVKEAQSALEDFTELDMRCNDVMTTTTAQQFPQIVKKVKDFKQMCSGFKLEFQQTLAKKLPLIRGGGAEEAELAEILRKRHSSPFNSNNLNEWVDCKEREIHILKSFTNMMTNTNIIPSRSHLYEESRSAEYVVCFVFTSLGSVEPKLSALSNYLTGCTEPEDLQGPLSHDVEREQWYASSEVAEEMKKKVKLFRDFAEVNKEKENVKFLTVGLTNDTHKGSSIYLYKDGFKVTENFEPPSALETVAAGDINHNSVTLKISPPRSGTQNITAYSVEYCVHGQDGWQKQTQPKAEEVTVSDLRPNSEYVFRCRAVTSVGVGPVSDLNGSIKTLPCSPPGKPTVEPNSSEISVSWEKPAKLGQDVQRLSYILEYAETEEKVKEEDLRWKQTLSRGEQAIISGLRSETEYAVRVRCDCGKAGRSKESLTVKVRTTTVTHLADVLRRTCEQIESGSPSVHRLPLKEDLMNQDGTRWFKFGKESSRQNRTILLFGATGSGKSTLINGMINYIVGVEWEDGFRLKLTEDQSGSGAHRQTSKVTVYKIHHQDGFKIPFSLTIVDTPEFGDTGDFRRGNLTTEQIRNLFSAEFGVADIDAVCFVAPAALAQLTAKHKYMLDSVFSIVGKNVAENIRILVTFADGRRPAVLEAIKASGVWSPETDDGLPLYFKFNNSALFTDNKSSEANSTGDEGFDRMCWIMGTKSMKRFFDALNVTDTKTLTVKPDVLKGRLRKSAEYLQEKIKLMFAKLDEINETRVKLCEHGEAIDRNKNFVFGVTTAKPALEVCGSGNFFNCQQCHISCSTAAESQDFCTKCPGKCPHSVHFLQKYKWEFKEVQQKITVEKVKEKYLKVSGNKMTAKELIDKLNEEHDAVIAEMVKLMDESVKCLNRLKEISLKPSPISTAEYIKLVIKGERSEAKPGWEYRVWCLNAMSRGH